MREPDRITPAPAEQYRALALSTFSFAVCFAVWTIFSIIGVSIKTELDLSETEFGILVATPILTGSISRLLLGIWTEQYGGRLVMTLQMLVTAACTWLLAGVNTYEWFLVAALGVGLAGGSFIVGVAYTSRWFEKKRQGTALGIFGVGNIGAAFTSFFAPLLVVALGWEDTARIYAVILAVSAVLFYLLAKEDPVTLARRRTGSDAVSLMEQLRPLRYLQIWRFSLYYSVSFGGFVALASWLPNFYGGQYEMNLTAAGALTALFVLPATVFRALGGWLSDQYGARSIMYVSFIATLVCFFILSYPDTEYMVHGIEGPIYFAFGMPLFMFVLLTMVAGFFMSLGMAAVYKHIPIYYPDHVGSVGGLVGMIGGLGGFFLPIAFGFMNDLVGIWTSCFMLLFAMIAVSLLWMHMAILRMERRRVPELALNRYLPEVQPDYKHEKPLAAHHEDMKRGVSS